MHFLGPLFTNELANEPNTKNLAVFALDAAPDVAEDVTAAADAVPAIRIFSRLHQLKADTWPRHPHLCDYVDVHLGREDRLFIIAESTSKISLKKHLDNSEQVIDSDLITKWSFHIASALSHIHSLNMQLFYWDLDCFLIDQKINISIFDYARHFYTDGGHDLLAPFGNPFFLPPDVLLRISQNSKYSSTLEDKVDTWAFGIFLLSIFLRVPFEDRFMSQAEYFQKVLSHEIMTILNMLIDDYCKNDAAQKMIRSCLQPLAIDRPTFNSILADNFFHDMKQVEITQCSIISNNLLNDVDIQNLTLLSKDLPSIDNPLNGLPLKAQYYLWRLAGGDASNLIRKAIAESRKDQNTKVTSFAIDRLPRAVKMLGSEGGRSYIEYGTQKSSFRRTDTIDDISRILLDLTHLCERVQSAIGPPLTEIIMKEDDLSADHFIPTIHLPDLNHDQNDAISWDQMPLAIKEVDVIYQFYRYHMFYRLMRCFPASLKIIREESSKDIHPGLRGYIWACLLSIHESDLLVEQSWDSLYKRCRQFLDAYFPDTLESEYDTAFRQIDVDIPRCHQYHPLLSSPVGHESLKHVLKCWVLSDPGNVYWQGLDSLAAPFVALNITNDAIAFACLLRFTKRFLPTFFLKSKPNAIQAYLCIFKQLISFHAPFIASKLLSLSFSPDLYAIPWFLTLFSHVLPLQKINHLWDFLIALPIEDEKNQYIPLCVGVSILMLYLRDQILEATEFSDCIPIFAELPDLEVAKLIQNAMQLLNATPISLFKGAFEERNMEIESWPSPCLQAGFFHTSNWMILDGRSEDSYIEGHLKGSVHVAFHEDEVMEAVVSFLQTAQSIPENILLVLEKTRADVALTLIDQRIAHVAVLFADQVESPKHTLCHCTGKVEPILPSSKTKKPSSSPTSESRWRRCME